MKFTFLQQLRSPIELRAAPKIGLDNWELLFIGLPILLASKAGREATIKIKR